MASALRIVAVIAVIGALGACEKRLIPVVPDGVSSGTTTAATDKTFEVVARIAGAKDPLPVKGTELAYSDLETALGQAVLRVVRPRHDSVLSVELIAGDASYKNTRLSVSLVVRATLRTRLGNTFVAQTTVVCRDGAIIAPESGTRVIWSCMTHLAQDLGGWLAGQPT